MWARVASFFSWLGFAWARRRLDEETRREFEEHVDLLAEIQPSAARCPYPSCFARR
jgi:hypothetical protein